VGDGFSAGLPDGFQGGDAPASPGLDESDAGAPEREPAAAGVA
ncbi:single-stranded DNA-binding protein, partial [Micrococcus luteus]|nr:single-stranded DNA-binding protein [Micrococcus luteus]